MADWLGPAIEAGGSIISGAIGAFSNKSGTKKTAKALKKALKLQEQAQAKADKELQEIKAKTQPGVDYLMRTIGEDGSLNAAQGRELQRLRLDQKNSLAQGGLRGSGRAITAAQRDGEINFIDRALENNRQRGLSTAGQVGGANFSASTGIGTNAVAGAGQQGDIIANIGQVQGQSNIANGQLAGQTLGQVSGAIAGGLKARDSDYDDRVAGLQSILDAINSDGGV